MIYLLFAVMVLLSYLFGTWYFIFMFYLDLFLLKTISVEDAYSLITSLVKLSLHPLNLAYGFLYLKTRSNTLKEGYIVFLEVVYFLSCRRFFR